jgi:hypothetical protein
VAIVRGCPDIDLGGIMRKSLILAGAAGLVLLPAAALASGSVTSPVSGQELAWDSTAVSTTTTSWASVPALSGLSGGCNVDGISAAVTVNVTGNPVELRAVNGPNILNPSSVTFRPPAGSGIETFSANFVGGQELNNTPLTTQVQWRLVTAGGSATLRSGSVVVLPGDSHCG